jgi:ubiquinol-cytochrome c reductase cytochrome c1 subunit
MSKDVAAFLVWTAEPKLDKRRQTGWPVLGFLLFATVLGNLAYRNVWRNTKH